MKYIKYYENFFTKYPKFDPNINGNINFNVKEISPKAINFTNKGYVDFIIPQLYHNNIETYKAYMDSIKMLVKPEYYNRFYPGILLRLGDYYPSEQLLKDFISENRKNGIEGEVYFFYEGLPKFSDLFKNELYKTKIAFPSIFSK